MKALEYIKNYWKLGALVGAGMPLALNLIGKIPGISVTQAAISVPIQTANTGLASWGMGLAGINITIPGIITSAIGGILFVALGAFLLDWSKLDDRLNIKSRLGRTTLLFLISGIATGAVLTWSIGIPPISAFIASVIGSLVLAFAILAIDDMFPMKIVP